MTITIYASNEPLYPHITREIELDELLGRSVALEPSDDPNEPWECLYDRTEDI